MGYKILLFDLDDTLLDFSANESYSLNKLFVNHGFAFTEELFSVYNCVNRQLWAAYENGTMTLDEVLNSRFERTMLEFGQSVDGAEWERQYRELLEERQHLIEGAWEVCYSLSAAHRLFVVTNGIANTQISRLKQSGLDGFFEDIFISETVGFQKPSKEFFNYVSAKISNFNHREALIIGDSLHTDIRGGLLAGIDTCWVNRSARACPAEIKSKYTITSLAELYYICAADN